jgi:hypothetical protein
MSGEGPADGTPLPADARVLRLPRPPPDFVPESWRPPYQLFEPSSDDKRHAEDRGLPVRVSVWDESLTSSEQARAFRAGRCLVLRVGVKNIRAVADQTNRALAVAYDRLEEALLSRPGAHGHAGIEGLARRSGEPKVEWKAALQRLADEAELIEWDT